MEFSIEMALFIVAIVWFLMVTILFMIIVKVSLEKDEMKKLKDRVDSSQKKLTEIHKRLSSSGNRHS